MSDADAVQDLIACLRRGDLAAVRQRLERRPTLARKPQLVVEAARLANARALAALLDLGGDPNATWSGYAPLHALIQEQPHGSKAASEQRLAALRLLLERGADLERPGGWPPSRPLILAAFAGQPAFLEAIPRPYGSDDVFSPSALGDLGAVEAALATDPGAARARDLGGLTALQACAGSRLHQREPRLADGLIAVARRLLEAGADPNARTRSWSHEVDVAYFACAALHARMLELLLEAGADATMALPSAVWREGTELAEIALRHGASIDRAIHEDKPLLNQLVRWGQVEPALWLLERGASADVPDERGWTAAHQAASRGNERLLRAILAAGADLTRVDREGCTPLDVARSAGRSNLVALLASRSAAPPPRSDTGGRSSRFS